MTNEQIVEKLADLPLVVRGSQDKVFKAIRELQQAARHSPASAAPTVDTQFEAKLLGFGEGDRIRLCEPCLRQAINDHLVSYSSALPAPVEQQTFKNTKEAMLYAQRNNIPAVVPVSDSSTSAREAAEEITNEYYFCNEDVRTNWKGREQEVYSDIAAIVERHCFPAVSNTGNEVEGESNG